jgi:hypothetical protein
VPCGTNMTKKMKQQNLITKFNYLVTYVVVHISAMWTTVSVCEELVIRVILALATLLG